MFLSIVIPVHNGAKTIERCLDSIWSQNLPFDDYEVICVDDCSTDDTVEKLNHLQLNYPQLRIVSNHENIRAGGSRNHGVRVACGEYILFIDADDYFHPGSLLVAYRYQKLKQLDILMCDFARHKDETPNNDLVHKFPSTDVMSGHRFLVVNTLPYAPWKYIFRRDLMVDNNVFFAEKVSCEDVDWTHKIALYAQTMQYQPILLTHYILFENSQTGSEYKRPETVFHRLMSGKRVTDLIPMCNTEEERLRIKLVAQETLFYGTIFLNGLLINPQKKAKILEECIDSRIEWRKELRLIRRYPLLYGWISTLISPLFRFSLKAKRKICGR